MPKLGRMGMEQIGDACNIPVHAPLYPKPPFYYLNADTVAITYETDEDSALDVLPDALELSIPATATVIIFAVPFGTLGRLHETVLSIRASWQGKPVSYVVYNLITSDAALAAGREIWGAPKKSAYINVERTADGVIGIVERPQGTRICTAMVRPETPTSKRTGGGPIPMVTMRVMPDPEGRKPIIQLVRSLDPGKANWTAFEGFTEWQGPGSISFDAISAVDPWYKLRVLGIRRAVYSCGPSRFELHYGEILKTYK